MGLVCSLAIMGNPMAITDPDLTDKGLALERLQQALVGDARFKVAKINENIYVASAEDLKDISVQNVPLVSCKRLWHLLYRG